MTVPNPMATFVVPSTNVQYRMGPLYVPDDVDVWWNTQLADGTFTVCAEPLGWEGLDYITPLDQVGGRDGALTGPPSIGPRVLDCVAMMVAPDPHTLRLNIARVRRILGPQSLTGIRGLIVWEQYDFGANRRLALLTRPTGKFAPSAPFGHQEGGVACTMSFTLVAANPPWKYSSGLVDSAEVGLQNPALLGGRTYDKTYNFTYGVATNPGGEMVVNNTGTIDAYPVFQVTGPVPYPVIGNVTTGREFTINRNMPAGDVVTIDSRTGVVTPGTVRLIGRPFTLAPGLNTIKWRSAFGSYDPAARLRLEWRSTYS
jgi:hypothetical protein